VRFCKSFGELIVEFSIFRVRSNVDFERFNVGEDGRTAVFGAIDESPELPRGPHVDCSERLASDEGEKGTTDES